MDVIRLADASPERLQRILRRSSAEIFDPARMAHVGAIIADVEQRGDAAIVEATARYDGVALPPEGLAVAGDEVRRAHDAIDDGLRTALVAAIERTRRYNERLRPPSLVLDELEAGITTGVKWSPVDAAGLYVPSGKGTFPSTLVTLVTPAVVAGVDEIAVVVAPRPDGSVDPAILVAADLLGGPQVFRCNGVAGIAGLACGTATLPRVRLLGGPGNPYVTAAQIAVQSRGVRLLSVLGPTESMILADEGADADRLALDLLNEAEHGSDSAALLVTASDALVADVQEHLPRYLAQLPERRRAFADAAMRDYGGAVVARSMEEAVAFVNLYAPEHLQIATRDPLATLAGVRHAGEVLLGQDTPFSAANYAIGVPAALPTSGFARVASGVTVLSYLKATSVAALDARGLAAVRPVVERLGRYEDFPAHVLAVTARGLDT
ncbi:MAG TPA: histidinol dehydrogenase [bacterium]|nr:histidinol dehydrogenase [bacterium]